MDLINKLFRMVVIHQEDEVTVGPVHHPETCFARAVQIGTDA